MTMTGGKIQNTSSSNHGGAIYNAGTFNMEGTASISGCYTTTDKMYGGAVYSAENSTFNMDGKSLITNCYTTGKSANGGGVHSKGTFTMKGYSAVTNCYTTGESANGGGVYVNSYTFNMEGNSSISGCSTKGTKAYGGGVYCYAGTVNMNGGTISSCSSIRGGAVYVTYKTSDSKKIPGSFQMTGGTIEKTHVTEYGGAVFVSSEGSSMTLSGGTIDGTNSGYGGGAIHVASGGNMTMSGGTINKTSAYIGGAVYNLGTLNMTGGSMKGCFSSWSWPEDPNGGGAVYNQGRFEMSGGMLDHCETDCNGGGVYQKAGELILSGDAKIEECKSNFSGGGVCIAGGTFTMSDDASIQKCGVSTNLNGTNWSGGGAGVSVLFTGKFTMNGGCINRNHAFDGYGGGLHNEGTVTINGGQINANSAYGEGWSQMGGGVYSIGDITMTGGEVANNIGLGGFSFCHLGNPKGAKLEISGGAIYGNYLSGKAFPGGVEYFRTADLVIGNKDTSYSVIPASQMTAEGQTFDCWKVLYDTKPQDLELTCSLPAQDGSYQPGSTGASYYHAVTTSDVKIPQGVYLDPQRGDDSQTGANALDPVLTWDKALELARERVEAMPDETVDLFLCSTLTLTGEQTLEMPAELKDRVVVKRALAFSDGNGGNFAGNKGYLIDVPGKGDALTLKNITLDGNLVHGSFTGSLVHVGRGASLTIEDGADLRNNLSGENSVDYRGGAVYIDGGECTMTGGRIEENETAYLGGGVSVVGGTFTLKGGVITENHGEYGGGISAVRGSTIHLLGGTILENGAVHSGGGIHIGGPTTAEAIPGSELVMEGGVIEGNHSTVGGGIFIQMNSKATISQGDIINNRTTLATTGQPYRGGGIYVNGGKNTLIQGTGIPDIEDGFLQLYDVEITGNDSPHVGGGLAMCPTGYMKLYISRGGAIYGNTTRTDDGKDIFVNEDLTGEPTYISDVMLGNGKNQWMYQGQPAPQKYYQGTQSRVYLTNEPSDEDIARAHAVAKVHITGNTAASSMGGGIASNGHIVIGENLTLIDIPVEKRWEHGENPEAFHPTQVTVRLYQVEPSGNIEMREHTLDASNGWKVLFKELDPQKEYIVVEDPSPGYTATVTGDAENGFVVTNTYHPTPFDIPVQKHWSYGTLDPLYWPSKVTVHLLCDGQVCSTLELSPKNGWQGVFTGLLPWHSYSVMEEAVPDFVTTITGSAQEGFVITNAYSKLPPKTGDSHAIGLWLLLNALSGVTLLCVWRRHKRRANG